MSFREYLLYEGIVDIEPITLEFIFSNHRQIAEYSLSNGMKVLPLFDDYLHHGYYPFYKSVFLGFEIRLQQIVDHSVTYPAKGDFLVDGKYLFEVVERKKSSEQIKDVADMP